MSRPKTFVVSTKSLSPKGDDLWESSVVNLDRAILILVHNGWTEEEAVEELSQCPDKWILVNETTQIC